MQSNKFAIGIDLGTSYSCVGVMKNGVVKIIDNQEGRKTTPSFVAFTNNDILVGDFAKNQMTINPENTAFEAKRLIGRLFDDPTIQNDIKHWPFKVINENGKPKIEVEFKKEKQCYAPENISAMVLKKMKTIAEDFLGTTVTDAVVTVPAYFANPARLATKNACVEAGLNLLGMINEPTAAALAYGLEEKFQEKKNILIFDLGGGTFDVTVLTVENSNFNVKSTSGNCHLGGEDFNNLLVTYVVNEFKNKHKIDLTTNKRAVCRIRAKCEEAKRFLSSTFDTTIIIDSIYKNIDLEIVITRDCFEKLCHDLFNLTLESVKNALQDANLEKSEIDNILLIGGSTRIPKVQELLKDFFNGKNLSKSINPDEAVAYGAAIHAAFLRKQANDTLIPMLQNLQLTDVTPFSIGTDFGKDDKMDFVIKRNSKIPSKSTQTYITVIDNQTTMSFSVYEGENEKANKNNLLGFFKIDGIPPAPIGKEKVDATFEIDNNGILNVTAVSKSTSKQNSITIALNWK